MKSSTSAIAKSALLPLWVNSEASRLDLAFVL